jgi:hypothetical protein
LAQDAPLSDDEIKQRVERAGRLSTRVFRRRRADLLPYGDSAKRCRTTSGLLFGPNSRFAEINKNNARAEGKKRNNHLSDKSSLFH